MSALALGATPRPLAKSVARDVRADSEHALLSYKVPLARRAWRLTPYLCISSTNNDSIQTKSTPKYAIFYSFNLPPSFGSNLSRFEDV